jgi:DNA-binding transcriptional regulator YiaG
MSNMNNKRLATIIKSIRIARDMSPAQFAELLDADVSSLWRWESGERVPAGRFLLQIYLLASPRERAEIRRALGIKRPASPH